MNKLLSALIASTFAFASVGAFAAAHGGAMSDKDKAAKNLSTFYCMARRERGKAPSRTVWLRPAELRPGQ